MLYNNLRNILNWEELSECEYHANLKRTLTLFAIVILEGIGLIKGHIPKQVCVFR